MVATNSEFTVEEKSLGKNSLIIISPQFPTTEELFVYGIKNKDRLVLAVYPLSKATETFEKMAEFISPYNVRNRFNIKYNGKTIVIHEREGHLEPKDIEHIKQETINKLFELRTPKLKLIKERKPAILEKKKYIRKSIPRRNRPGR
ncbi:MAG: hypothetical protein V1824_02365 [archaeon]